MTEFQPYPNRVMYLTFDSVAVQLWRRRLVYGCARCTSVRIIDGSDVGLGAVMKTGVGAGLASYALPSSKLTLANL